MLVNCGYVLLENNVVCKVVGVGTIKVKMFGNVARTLMDVRHVPDLQNNLISLEIGRASCRERVSPYV